MATQAVISIEHAGFKWRGLVGGVALISAAAVVVASAPLVVPSSAVRALLTAGGWCSLIVGIAWRLWATLYVGGRKPTGHHEAKLTVDGPYSVVRNPLYVGSLFIGLSTALLLHSAVLLFAVVVAALHYCWSVVPAEEAFLRRVVGADTFDPYVARTPRWIPNFGLFTTPATASFQTKALRKETARAMRLIAGGILMTLLAAARCEAWWPHWLTLP
jgi:protein-S-isoprenylcysteine O-methyltransferase Ste14